MRAAVRLMLMAIMNEEHLWAHHTACQVRRGGITVYTCDLVTTVGKFKGLVVPRTRGPNGRFFEPRCSISISAANGLRFSRCE